MGTASEPALRCSIVIPAHDRRHQLANTLESLSRQTVAASAFEAVVVDDGSADGTRALMTRRSWPFAVRYIRKTNTDSRAQTRNLGVLASRGPITICLDAEMLCPPGFVQAHLELHDHYGPCVVCGWHDRLTRYVPEPLPGAWLQRARDRGATPGCHPAVNSPDDVVPFVTANCSCRRADLLEAGLFDEAFTGYGHEDLDMGMRLYLLGCRFVSCPTTMAYHQPHARPRGLDADVQDNVRYYMRKHHRHRRVTHLSDFLNAGGIERCIIALARCLHGRQHDFRWVVANAPAHYRGELEALGVPVDVVPHRAIGDYLAAHPADLLHIHTPFEWLEPLRQSSVTTPTLVTIHFPAPVPPTLGADRIVCVTDGLARGPRGEVLHYPVIHPGTDPRAFAHQGRTAQARARFRLPAAAFVIGTAARMDETKLSQRMLGIYLEIVRLNPRIHVLLMGTGRGREELLARVAREGLADRVHLPGAVDDVSLGLEALDAFVHAVEDEPFGIAVLEALAKGLPVVCSDVLGPRVTVGETGAGFVCTTGAEMVRRVLELADGRHDLRELRRRALAAARLFDDRRTAFRYKLLYDEVIDGARYRWPAHSA